MGGGAPTVERYKGNPKVQAHGPGFSKILLGDDQVDLFSAKTATVDAALRFADEGGVNGVDFLAWGYQRTLAETVELEKL